MTSPDSKSFAIEFEDYVSDKFTVEHATKGDDVIYHYFPPANDNTFMQNFGVYLERAYKRVLPENADVRADFINLDEAKLILRHSQDTSEDRDPAESFYVCVKDMASNPMSDVILKQKIFTTLEEELANVD